MLQSVLQNLNLGFYSHIIVELDSSLTDSFGEFASWASLLHYLIPHSHQKLSCLKSGVST